MPDPVNIGFYHRDTEDTEKSLIKGFRIHHRDTEDTEKSFKSLCVSVVI